jgi:hypothetical protein
MKPVRMTRIVERKKYDTNTAILLAGDDYWDGHNWERHGRNGWLYRTPNGAYFKVTRSMWQGEQDTLLPISQTEAIELFENDLSEQRVTYAEAFPGVKVEEA